MDKKNMADSSSQCLREHWVLHLPTAPVAFSVATAWSPSCIDPPGELGVCRGKGSAKGKPRVFPPNLFSRPSSAIMLVTLDFRERSVLDVNSAYFSVSGSSPPSIRLHPTSGSVDSLEQGLIAHIRMATSRHHPCSTALSVTEYSSDFK